MSRRLLNKRQLREQEELAALKAIEQSAAGDDEPPPQDEESEEDAAGPSNPFAAVCMKTLWGADSSLGVKRR